MAGSDPATETIAAVSTPPGEGAIGIVRISGPAALPILRTLFRSPTGRSRPDFPTHRLHYGHIVDAGGETLDEVLAVFMTAPKTYTREDVAEIHCHGGPAAVREILRRAIDAGARPAEPGEFTLRAFLNGRLDLTRAEAVMDVIRSTTRRSLRVAAGQLGGRLGGRLNALRDDLTTILAHLEASIDFSDEDLPPDLFDGLDGRVAALEGGVAALLGSYEQGRLFRDGAAVAIVGRPNVGKSSLLNRLLAEDRAIVTEIPGTTRDIIEETFSLNGIPVRLLDTAGIRHSRDRVEQEGIRRSHDAVAGADVVLLVLDGSAAPERADRELLEQMRDRNVIVVRNKADLPLFADALWRELDDAEGLRMVPLSARTGQGLESLLAVLEGRLVEDPARMEDVMLTRARHRDALAATAARLRTYRQDRREGASPEILALDLREALDGLDRILGVTSADDILGVIFSDFCIGK